MQRTRGFTLIELVIVVAVIAILAAIAINSYKEQVRKARRAEAVQNLSDIALREEKWRSYNSTYGSIANVGATALVNATNSPYYTVTASALTGTTYTLTATPRGGSAQVGDRCGNFVFTMTNGTVARTATGGTSTCY